MKDKRYLTVTALTRYLKRKIEKDPHLQDVWIKAEISNFTAHARGHMYMTLKDENARIQAVMFSSYNRFLKFKPEDGLKVIIHGEISIYEPYGQYQLYIKEMQPDGIGNLYLAFEELKKKLQNEGLFAEQRKRPIPLYPNEIGVITSPSGAAIRDILITIKRRFPIARITIIPVLVQGEEAAPSIVKGIRRANEFGNFDVLIIGRGGGSLEDLWPFNEEIVAREIFCSKTPIISAVGHETDFTISDFVADLRAPTPTAAAELAVPHVDELVERIYQRKRRITRIVVDQVNSQKNRIIRLQKSYAFRYPEQLLTQKEQQLDRLLDSLNKGIIRHIDRKNDQYTHAIQLLRQKDPYQQMKMAKANFEKMFFNLHNSYKRAIIDKRSMFQHTLTKLNALNPLNVMERGYSLVYDEKQKLIKSVKQIQPGDSVKVELKDGHLDCQVWGMEESEKNDHSE